jgi:hypothetical protein
MRIDTILTFQTRESTRFSLGESENVDAFQRRFSQGRDENRHDSHLVKVRMSPRFSVDSRKEEMRIDTFLAFQTRELTRFCRRFSQEKDENRDDSHLVQVRMSTRFNVDSHKEEMRIDTILTFQT